MTPIHEIINRIVWDTEFGNADVVIGYYDRVFKRIVRVSFERIRIERGQHFGFDLIGRDGEARMVPFHRVREVARNGELVWSRPAPG
ncbi:DUF504 domain-containing protein [Massilia sp. CMS3.1]|uniref:DUF504 domain-containing protein n=1 Tax=Massilia sp. CMS3.1 TaxID=3373083 RepID=UPI003EE7AD65